MADKSGIQWTDATWNPTTGCDRVSPGCANCYALTWAARMKAMGQPGYQLDGDPKTSGPGFGFQMHEDRLDIPLHWSKRKPRRIFVDSMSDLFHDNVDERFLDRVFAVMALAPWHTFQVLTKRPELMREYFADVAYRTEQIGVYAELRSGLARYDDEGTPTWPLPLPNVWLGTSVENARWRTRIDELRQIPAAVRFLSCEPLLGPLVDWFSEPCPACNADRNEQAGSIRVPGGGRACERCGGPDEGAGWLSDLDLAGIDWVIVGGESGKGARPMNEQWVRDIVDECRRQRVAPFVKQMGKVWAQEHLGRSGHAGDIERFPADLRIREFPAVAS